jgi:O-antigen/teichoic acid export membrane protein
VRQLALGRLLRTGSESRGRRLAAQTAGTVGLNAATLVFNFLLALLLSRLLGPDGYGAYAFAVAWALVLAVPGMLGLTPLVVREIATYRVRRDWSRARGLLRRANQAVVAASLVVSVTAAGAFLALDWPEPGVRKPTLVALALIPLLTLVAVRQSAMQGFGAVVLARVPEALVAPMLTIVLVLLLEAWLAGGLSATSAVGSQVLAAAGAALLGVYLLRRTLPDEVRRAEPLDEARAWLVGAAPLLVLSGIQAVNVQAGTILTGSIAGAEEAGIFSVTFRITALLSFLLLATVPALTPTVAELYERGESQLLQRLMARAARLVFLGTVPLALAAIVFARPILHLFGDDFGDGVTALRIMCVGQLIAIATGLPGTILLMVGEAGQATWAVAAGTAVNLLVSATLIPAFGAEGAAVGAAVSVAFMNLLMTYLLWRRRSIYAAALPLRPSSS